MSALCPTNLTLPWLRFVTAMFFKKITILALIAATILMFSNRICIFTLIVAIIYHLGITAHQQKGI